jgi:3',5'-cyclic AMP phosphodiesterase CpdA
MTPHNQQQPISRRNFIAQTAGLAAGAAVASSLSSTSAAAKAAEPFRFVHLTDIHLMLERRAPEGLAACLDALNKLDRKPAFIATGGDQCDNLRALNYRDAKDRIELFLKIWNDHTSLPTHHCLGNHDPAGWTNKQFPSDHPQYGKKLMMDLFGMKRSFYSFDHGGWHFIVLDNIKLTEPGKFIGEFMEEQLDFLKKDIAQHKSDPTLVICHVPPISAEEFLGGKITAGPDAWTVPYGRVCRNTAELLPLLDQGHVKCILSGHIHHVERIETHGHTFICGGAVAGDWWQGALRGCPAGFGIFDCNADGTFSYRYHDFGWKPAV